MQRVETGKSSPDELRNADFSISNSCLVHVRKDDSAKTPEDLNP